MNRSIFSAISIIFLLLLGSIVLANPNNPTPFGNGTITTVYIGGQSGIVNATGNILGGSVNATNGTVSANIANNGTPFAVYSGGVLHTAISIAGTTDTLSAGSNDLVLNGNSIYFQRGGTTYGYLATTGKFGIGTTNPQGNLHINATQTTFRTGSALFRLDRPSNTANTEVIALTNGLAVDYLLGRNNNSDDLIFGTDNGATFSEQMRINATNGFLGVGTAAPTTRVDVAGSVRADALVGDNITSKSTGSIRTLQPLKVNTSTSTQALDIGGNTNSTGVIYNSVGAVATPAYSFSGFPTYGVYMDTSNGMDFVHAGVVGAGFRTNALVLPAASQLVISSTTGTGGTLDTGLSRISAGVFGVTQGTQTVANGSLWAASVNASGTVYATNVTMNAGGVITYPGAPGPCQVDNTFMVQDNLINITCRAVNQTSLTLQLFGGVLTPLQLNATNSPSNLQVPVYNSTTGSFTWQNQSGTGGSGNFTQFTVADKVGGTGTVSNATVLNITGDSTISTSLTGTKYTLSLTNTGVTAGTYGGGATVPVITVDAQGRVTSVVSNNIQAGTTSQSGILQLQDSVSSTSISFAATSNSVKTAYDLANSKGNISGGGGANDFALWNGSGNAIVDSIMNQSGQTVGVNGNLTINDTLIIANPPVTCPGDNVFTVQFTGQFNNCRGLNLSAINLNALNGTLNSTKGGTGFNSFTKGDILIANSTTVLGKLGVGTNTYVLTANSSAVNGVDWEPSTGSGSSGGGWLNTSTQVYLSNNATNVTVNNGTFFADTANGRVGVGTVTPATALDVRGNITSNNLTTTNLVVLGACTGCGGTNFTYVPAVGGVGQGLIINDTFDLTDENWTGYSTPRANGWLEMNGSDFSGHIQSVNFSLKQYNTTGYRMVWQTQSDNSSNLKNYPNSGSGSSTGFYYYIEYDSVNVIDNIKMNNGTNFLSVCGDCVPLNTNITWDVYVNVSASTSNVTISYTNNGTIITTGTFTINKSDQGEYFRADQGNHKTYDKYYDFKLYGYNVTISNDPGPNAGSYNGNLVLKTYSTGSRNALNTSQLNTGTVIYDTSVLAIDSWNGTGWVSDAHANGDLTLVNGLSVIGAGAINASKLLAANTPTSGQVPTYNSTSGGFTWANQGGATATLNIVKMFDTLGPASNMLLLSTTTGNTVSSWSSSAKCTPFYINGNSSAVVDTMVTDAGATTNSTIGINMGIYSCTGGGISCTSGNLVINSTMMALSANPMNYTNATGNWTLAAGLYNFCMIQNATSLGGSINSFRTTGSIGSAALPGYHTISGCGGSLCGTISGASDNVGGWPSAMLYNSGG